MDPLLTSVLKGKGWRLEVGVGSGVSSRLLGLRLREASRRKKIGQIDDFDRFFNNSCNLGVFLDNKKIPKNDCFEKVKIEEKNVFF